MKLGLNPNQANLIDLADAAASTYEPISSVWEGSDADLLEAMFKFYATIPPELILDSTNKAGRSWNG